MKVRFLEVKDSAGNVVGELYLVVNTCSGEGQLRARILDEDAFQRILRNFTIVSVKEVPADETTEA